MRVRRSGHLPFSALVALGLALTSSRALADEPNGARLVRILGDRALPTLSNGAGISAFVRTKNASALGLRAFGDDVGALRGTPSDLAAFAASHPDLSLEVSPPLHLLMDRAKGVTHADQVQSVRGLRGEGVIVGIVDSGLNVAHPDFRNADGTTRIKWYLDLSRPPIGLHPELEAQFKVTGTSGDLGAVLNAADINGALAVKATVPTDLVGHGTHVAGIAAAGEISPYSGMAPKADLIVVQATREDNSVDPLDMVNGSKFVFDRAAETGQPAVVNLSLGSDFGPHDGTFSWEVALAALVGPTHPGRSIVVAAGNTGSIAEFPVHASVHVTEGATYYVPMDGGRAKNGNVTVWVALRQGADLTVGLIGPAGTIIPQTEKGEQFGRNVLTTGPNGETIDKYNSGVIFGDGRSKNLVPKNSSGAVVVMSGQFRAGRYYIALEGKGDAELYLQAGGDVAGFGFSSAVREGTVNLPATHPDIISVGCTVGRDHWSSIAGVSVTFGIPILDAFGGRVREGSVAPHEGDVCWFSSAGPNLNGVPKPEIGAPGGSIISAMSEDASPSSRRSVFYTTSCPARGAAIADFRCLQIDETHAILSGTSMSSPMVAGAVALFLQADPTLTQAEITMLLQAGAHPFRGDARYEGHGGPGELDLVGSLTALAAYRSGTHEGAPVFEKSWVSLAGEVALASGSVPFDVIYELRTADGSPADLVAGDGLVPDVRIDGESLDVGRATRKGPGVWQLSIHVPEASGGKLLRVGAKINGASVVPEKQVPIATDNWTAFYTTRAFGGCAVGSRAMSSTDSTPASSTPWTLFGAMLGLALVRRRLRRA